MKNEAWIYENEPTSEDNTVEENSYTLIQHVNMGAGENLSSQDRLPFTPSSVMFSHSQDLLQNYLPHSRSQSAIKDRKGDKENHVSLQEKERQK